MRQDKTAKNKKDKTTIALLLAFCVMVAFSFFTVKSTLNKISDNNSNLNLNNPSSVDLPVSSKIPTIDSKTTDESIQFPKQYKSKFIAPVDGSILSIFSKDMPIYSKTLDQYVTHLGVDISGANNSPVAAVSDGTVTKITMDDRYGNLIEINHGDGYCSIYGNLADTDMVELGDVVKMGDTIGKIGSSSLFEISDEPHLHFELLKDGEHVDPTGEIKFN